MPGLIITAYMFDVPHRYTYGRY